MKERRNGKEPNLVAIDPLNYTNDPSGVFVQNLPQQERSPGVPGRWSDAIGQKAPSPVRRMDYPRDPHRA
ncbi:hypothetical protein SAMN05444008_11226 [Cnuella takakiae]|uniref:Uncharacterized protein n=1 Tax=Cnuella takakiae TaxID=1302690 RepID=A0A1M5EFB3_9BACT|nr:hypothetical protein [Cnuella takakiae]OLY91162.1 hypothetical protein BUE76_04035 [Cnuella takakiae]SHF77983.1 hypothetical protein SAMN05444008_11226 [Cnuella takakiae]